MRTSRGLRGVEGQPDRRVVDPGDPAAPPPAESSGGVNATVVAVVVAVAVASMVDEGVSVADAEMPGATGSGGRSGVPQAASATTSRANHAGGNRRGSSVGCRAPLTPYNLPVRAPVRS
jgi:hypothetical protein